jgi:hypothetical protein
MDDTDYAFGRTHAEYGVLISNFDLLNDQRAANEVGVFSERGKAWRGLR